MEQLKYNNCILFGGAGFIGTHLAAHLLELGIVDQVFLADFKAEDKSSWAPALLAQIAQGKKIIYIQLDVREPISHPDLPKNADLVINLAATHKEPGGHTPDEYFSTNIPGAEYVCNWASEVSAKTIIFSSSIATYGTLTDEPKTELSLTMPLTPYGVSKLAAEKIHLIWQAKNSSRKLLIVRPGVIFGAGEQGNVTQMVRAIIGRYFFYAGNKNTPKAGGYVKELCHSIVWMLQMQATQNLPVVLYNFTMDPAPTIEQYAQAIERTAGITRLIPNIPYSLLLTGAHFIHGIAKLFGIKQPITPVRIKKLRKANNIAPKILKQNGYQYKYSLDEALTDWLREKPEDWNLKK